MTRVKVCGITRPEDAAVAVALGTDALGFVFWPRSPRFVEVECATAIVRELPPFVTAVGVFVDERPDEIRRVVTAVGLQAVQLHGDETVSEYTGIGRSVIKAVSVGPGRSGERALSLPARVTVLFDAHDPVRHGGTGQTIDWVEAARVARARRVILAGGLRPENVGDAILAVRPYAVDVSSGVESEPGTKDAGLMRAFFDAVRRIS